MKNYMTFNRVLGKVSPLPFEIEDEFRKIVYFIRNRLSIPLGTIE